MRRLLFGLLAFTISTVASAQVYVHGYTNKNGTYVAPHYRSSPDGNPFNNYSTRGNVNPYTGQVGTKDPYSSYGSTSNSYSNPYSSSSTTTPQTPSTSTCLYYTPC